MNWHFDSMHSFIGGGMWLFWLILLIVIILLFKIMGTQSKTSDSPMELLKKRYANGEINKEEFEEIKKTLQS